MAYDTTKHVNLGQLSSFSDAINAKFATQVALATLEDKVEEIAVPEYSLIKDDTSADYAAVYHLTKNGVNEGVAINIPKDMVV